MPNNQTKRLTQGAMMIAIFAVLVAIALYIPVISIVASVFALLPIAWFNAKYDRMTSIMVSTVAVVITFFFGGFMVMAFSLIFAATGVAIGDALRTKKSKLFLLISTSLTLLFTFAIQYIIALRLFEFDFIKNSMQLMRTTYEQSITLSEQITGTQIVSKENLNTLFSLIEMAQPAIITISVFAFAFVLIVINLPVLKRLGIQVPKFKPFKNMRLPQAILWYYLIVLVISMFVKPEFGSMLYVIVLNFSVLLWILFTLQGLSFIYYVIDIYGAPSFLKVLITILIIPLYSFVVLLGIVDLGFNLRAFIKGKTQKK